MALRSPGEGAHIPMRVVIEEMSPTHALCRNQLGRSIDVPLEIVRTGLTPHVDEVWLIDQIYGVWTLAARVGPEVLA